MKSIILATLALAALTAVEGLKCYANPPGNDSNPIKYPQDIPDATDCVRYKYTCPQQATANDTTCNGRPGQTVTAYTAVGSGMCDQMKGAPSVYQELLCCTTDFCNSADAKSDAVSAHAVPRALVATAIAAALAL